MLPAFLERRYSHNQVHNAKLCSAACELCISRSHYARCTVYKQCRILKMKVPTIQCNYYGYCIQSGACKSISFFSRDVKLFRGSSFLWLRSFVPWHLQSLLSFVNYNISCILILYFVFHSSFCVTLSTFWMCACVKECLEVMWINFCHS